MEEPRGSDRVHEILDAACRVIGRDGAHGLRIEAVAREAGVSKPLVHYYFATRRALVRAAFLHADERAEARTDQELAHLATAAERLATYLLLELGEEDVFVENRQLWSAAWSLMQDDEELAPEVERLYRAFHARLVGLVEAGVRDGSIPEGTDAERTARRLGAVVDGLESQLLLGLASHDEAAQTIEDALRLAGITLPNPQLA